MGQKVLVKLLKNDIAPVHQLESTSFNRNLAHHLCIVDLI